MAASRFFPVLKFRHVVETQNSLFEQPNLLHSRVVAVG
jgi:hypothetical protein